MNGKREPRNVSIAIPRCNEITQTTDCCLYLFSFDTAISVGHNILIIRQTDCPFPYQENPEKEPQKWHCGNRLCYIGAEQGIQQMEGQDREFGGGIHNRHGVQDDVPDTRTAAAGIYP